MASNGTVAHRFANRDYNFERGLKGSSTHIEGRNYYSYSTVFGQWVDEKVCLVYHGETSVTSNQHKLWDCNFPKDVTLFPYDDGGSGYYGSWHGCDLLGRRGEFDYEHRVRLMDYWIGEIYDALHDMVDGKQKDLDKNAERIIEEYWAYVEKLCSMYKDTSVYMWLKKKRIDTDGTWKRKKIIVKALYKGEREVRVLVDAAFGQGTYKKYYEYCGRYRKAEDNKAKMIELCHRLGMSTPYRDCWHEGGHYAENPYKTAEIRKLTARQRVDLHFANLMDIEWRKHEDERKKKYEKNKWNAYRWITGYSPIEEKSWYTTRKLDDVKKCRNMYTGEEYDLSGDHIYGFYWAKTSVSFEYDNFRKSENKDEWIRNFYAKCKEVQDNREAISILKWAKANTKEKVHSYDDDVYILDEKLTEIGMNAESLRVVTEFIERQDKHYADEEARKRAMEIERQRQAEERKREKEYQKQVKQEQIDACIERGGDGFRDLWRLHLTDLYDAHHEFDKANLTGCPEKYKDFFFGGNVLLRLNLDKTYVESSKGVRVPVAVARLWFKKVKQWHENPKSFKPMEWNTKGNGKYTVSEYKDDILTAGCHDIAYAEMERMYNQILAECA
jgi:hypothetical protein